MENIERLHQNEIILPLIVLLDPSVEETEHNRVLDELQKTVTMIYSNDRTLVDLMIVDKIPAFFDAVFEENIVPRYSTVTNEIAEYVLWKVAKRKQEYRVNSVTYLVPIVLLICDSLNPDVLTLLKNPEWARNIKNRVFYFTLCSTHEKNMHFEIDNSQYEVEVFSAEGVFEKFCSKVRDYAPLECRKSMPTECSGTVKVNLPNPALYGLCVEAEECDNRKEVPDLEEYMRIIEIEI